MSKMQFTALMWVLSSMAMMLASSQFAIIYWGFISCGFFIALGYYVWKDVSK